MLETDASAQGGVPEPTGNPTSTPMPNTGINSQIPNNMQSIPENVDFHTPGTVSEPCPTLPVQREDGPENRNNAAPECEGYNWGMKNLKLDDDGNFLDPNYNIPDYMYGIVAERYAEEAWPTWEDLPSSQLDLLYEDFKECCYWLPEDERQIKQNFETELKSCLDLGPCDSESEEEYEEEEEFYYKWERENSNKIFLDPEDKNVRRYMDVGMDVDYIIDMTYKDKPWPSWIDVPQSQWDLWYEKLKEYYYWCYEDEMQMRKHFMIALRLCFQLKAEYNARNVNPDEMNELLKEEYTAMDPGKRPMDYEVDGIVSERGTEDLKKSIHLLQNRPCAHTFISKFFEEIKVMGNFNVDSKQMYKEVAEKEGMEAYNQLIAVKEAEHKHEWMQKKKTFKLLSEIFTAHQERWSSRDENDSVDDEWQKQKCVLKELWKLLKIKLQCYQGEEDYNDNDLFSDSETWPTWKVIPPSQCDLYFMRLCCWLPEEGTDLKKYFMTEVRWRLKKARKLDFDEEHREFEDKEGIEQENSEKAFLTLAFLLNDSEYCEVMRKVEDILNSNHACWPAWEEVSRYHLDLWYKDFKEYYYWLPEDESLMSQAFEKCTSICIDVYEEIFEQENSEKTFLKHTFFQASSDPTEKLNNIKRTIMDILDTEYIIRDYWPTWQTVAPPQLDLWYEKFKEYYCWLPTHDSSMRTVFELKLQIQLNLEEHNRHFKNRLKREYKAMLNEYEEGKRPIEYKERSIKKIEQIWLDPPE